MKIKRITYFNLVLLLIVAGLACNPVRDRWINRQWHTLTGHYNVYFNGEKKYNDAMETLEKGHHDDFTKIIDVFPYGTEAGRKAIGGVMDEVTKKASLTIQNHNVGSFSDNAYLLLGKAAYFKDDYYAAIEPFQYINSHPKYKLQGLRPISTCWIAKCYMGLQKEGEAEAIMGLLMNEIDPIQLQGKLAKETTAKVKVSKDDKAMIYATAADIAIKQSNYTKAIEKLLVANKFDPSKQHCIRYTYILAQLYLAQGKNKEANAHFKKILTMIAPYNFEFNAALNLARAYDSTDRSAVRKVRRSLKRMLHDDKNDGMYDQILYEMGNLELREKKIPDAIKYYKQSAAKSTKNPNQKGLSFLALANIYLAQPEYKLAQAYYDSAAGFFKPDFKDYDKIMAKKTVLSELISNYIVIETEDSLQKLSMLSKDEMEMKIDEWIKNQKLLADKKKKAEQKQKEIDKSNSLNTGIPSGAPALAFGGDGSAQWYFYNPSIIAGGAQEFFSQKKWGQRANVDYWRIAAKEKEASSNDQVTDGTKSNNDTTSALDSMAEKKEDVKNAVSTDRKAWIANVPFSSAEIKSSNEKILEAYYNIGLVYDEKLNDQKEAINAFIEMLKRFPSNKFEPEVLYRMYKIYAKRKITMQRADETKALLIKKYPESPYALILQNKLYDKSADNDPNVLVTRLYGKMYDAYLDGKYDDVKNYKMEAAKKFPGNKIQPKYDLLFALTIGKTEPLPEFKSALQDVVKNYPKTDVAERAQHILDFMGKVEKSAKIDTAGREPEPEFVMEPTSGHYYVFAIKNDKLEMTDYVMKFNQFCEEFHQFDNLRVNTMVSNEGYQLILIKEFKDLEKGVAFIKDLDMVDYISKMIKPENPYKHFIISSNNLKKMLKDQKLDVYDKIYKKLYAAAPIPKQEKSSPQIPMKP